MNNKLEMNNNNFINNINNQNINSSEKNIEFNNNGAIMNFNSYFKNQNMSNNMPNMNINNNQNMNFNNIPLMNFNNNKNMNFNNNQNMIYNNIMPFMNFGLNPNMNFNNFMSFMNLYNNQNMNSNNICFDNNNQNMYFNNMMPFMNFNNIPFMNFNNIPFMNFNNTENSSKKKQNEKAYENLYPFIKGERIKITFINSKNESKLVKIPKSLRKDEIYSIAEKYKSSKYYEIIRLVHNNEILENDESSIDCILNGDSINITEFFDCDLSYYDSILLKHKNSLMITNIVFNFSYKKTFIPYLPNDITVIEMK